MQTVERIARDAMADPRVVDATVGASRKVARIGTTSKATAKDVRDELSSDDYTTGLTFAGGRWQVVLRAWA